MAIDDDAPRLEFADLRHMREPYNRGIATLSLRPVANRPDDGYKIHLTATFGSQVVKLRAGNTLFDVVFEIYEAEVLVRELKTKLSFGPEYYEHTEFLKAARHEETERVSGQHHQIGVSASGVSGGFSNDNRVTTRSSNSFIPNDFDHASLRHVKIGNRKRNHFLEKRVIIDYCGWFAKPESTTDPSGVRADLIVEDSWIKLKEPKTESHTTLSKLWNKISNSNLKEHKRKKELFSDLLRKLSILNLQSTRSGYRATLHSAAIICIPAKDVDVRSIEHSEPETLELDEKVLIDFLECQPGNERRMISAIVRQASKYNKDRKSFIPHSAVLSALNAYEYICNQADAGTKWKREHLEQKFDRNEIKDLMAAGLAENEKGYINPVNLFPGVTEARSFRIYLSRIPLFEFVRDLLIENPDMTPSEIGFSVATFLQKTWESTTHRSYGHRLRSWTAYAFGDLILDKSGHPLHLSLGELEKDRPRIGSRRFINNETLKRISEMKASGMTISQMAKEFKISAETIRKFKRDNPRVWERL